LDTTLCNQRGGGVSIFVRQCFPVTSTAALQLNSDVIECCAVKLSLSPSSSLNVVGIYCPPNPATVENFNSALSDILSNHFRSVDKVISAGDFNIDLIDPNDAALSLIDNFHSHSFIPLITKPTHVTNIRASLIDHVWTNILSPISSVIFDVDITDHFPVLSIFDLLSRREPIKKLFRDHSIQNLTCLKREIIKFVSQFNDSQNSDFNQKVSEIHEKLNEIYNQCCPIRCKILSHNKIMKPSISDAIVMSINRKHELARQFRDGLVDREVYTQFRNALTRTLRIEKTAYYCNKFESCRGDIRKTWKNLNYF